LKKKQKQNKIKKFDYSSIPFILMLFETDEHLIIM